jgi:hypothetical protein
VISDLVAFREEARSMASEWKEKQERVRAVLEKEFGVGLSEWEAALRGTKNRGCKFDLVSPDGSIVGEVKTFTPIKNGRHKPFAKISGTSEACFFLIHAKRAKKRLLVLTDREFFELYKRERSAEIAESEGVDIRLVEV